jgi:hypothetical protein
MIFADAGQTQNDYRYNCINHIIDASRIAHADVDNSGFHFMKSMGEISTFYNSCLVQGQLKHGDSSFVTQPFLESHTSMSSAYAFQEIEEWMTFRYDLHLFDIWQ